MSDEFWESPEKYTISPSEPEAAPSGMQNPYLTLFARIDVSFNGLVEELSSLDGVKVAPFESYHLTLKQIGEFGEDDISQLVSEVSDEIRSTESFKVKLEGVDVFPNCVYVPVVEAEALESLHCSLCSLPSLESNGFEGDDYIPHVTIAKFVDESVDSRAVYEVLENYRDEEWVELRVERIHLVKDKPVQAENVVFPPFESVGEFVLKESDAEGEEKS